MADSDSVSLHPHVQMVVRGGVFLDAVRAYCILLKSTNTTLTDDEIRQVALTHSYPRIGLILATSKDKEGAPILGGMGAEQDYKAQYLQVIRLITSPPYRDDIHRIAAQLTAAQLIKQLPLNSTLQFFNLGVQLEEQAIKDLERMSGTISLSKSQVSTQLAIYIHSQSGAVQTPPPSKPYCWYYITTLDTNNYLSSKEGLIELPQGDINNAIHHLTGELNEAFIDAGANLIANPNQIQVSDDTAQGVKVIYSLGISSRLNSPKVSREMIAIRFLSCTQTNIHEYKDNITIDHIPNLEYGVYPESLTQQGPHSLVIDVKAGDASKLATSATSSSSTQGKGATKTPLIDTIYFKGEGLQGQLVYRVSTPDLLGNTPYRTIEATHNANRLALDLLQDLHNNRWQNLVIGSLPYPYALRAVIANPLENNQLKVVIDLISLPVGLEVALGDELYRATPYEPGPRSVTLLAVNLLHGGSGGTANNQGATLGGQVYGSASVLNKKMSPRLQAVYDKLNQLGRGGKC